MMRERESMIMRLTARPDPDWMLQASCAQTAVGPGNDPWFAEGIDTQRDRALARRICRDCPVWRECRTDIDQIESSTGVTQWGIRAGETPNERRKRREGEQEAAA